MRRRIVVDTNVFVSGALFPLSVPGRAVLRALNEAILLLSEPTWNEVQAVFQKTKIAKYLARETALELLEKLRQASELIAIPSPIRACRDARDDKFLEVAVHGRADLLITGDEDLLVLHPFEGVAILTPADYLGR